MARRIPPKNPPRSRRRLALVLGIATLVALVIFFPGSSTLLTDWWWFREIGYQVVFTRTLITRALLFLTAGGLTAGLLYLNLRIAQRGLVANPILLQLAESAPRLNVTVALRRLTVPFSLGLRTLQRVRRHGGVGPGAASDLPDAVRHRGSGLLARHRLLCLHPARALDRAGLPAHPHDSLAPRRHPGLRRPR